MTPQIIKVKDQKGNELVIANYTGISVMKTAIQSIGQIFSASAAPIESRFSMEIAMVQFSNNENFSSSTAAMLPDSHALVIHHAAASELGVLIAGSIDQGISSILELEQNPQIITDAMKALTEENENDETAPDDKTEAEAPKNQDPLPKQWDANDLLRRIDSDKKRKP